MPAHSPINLPTPAAMTRYILAGNSTFSMKNTERDTHFSFTVTFNGGWPARVYSLGVGQERRILGLINFRRSYYRVGRSELPKGSGPQVCFAWLWKRLEAQKPMPAKVEAWHHGNCCRCHRELTDPASLERGFGPVCWEIMQGSLKLSAQLMTVAAALRDGESLDLPAPLTGLKARHLAGLLELLAGVSIEQWEQARQLTLAMMPTALAEIDSIIAAQIRTINGGAAKKKLAIEVADAADLNPFWIAAIAEDAIAA